MRIEKPKDLARTKKKSSASQVNSSGEKFTLGMPTPAATLTGAQATSNINNIGALLSAQEVDSSKIQAKAAVKRGTDMLDMLDQLKVGLLNGRVSPTTLNRLKTLATNSQNLDSHKNLKKVLNSIELRAEVELAKLAQQKSQ